jgi:hypothetical protein
MPDVTPLDRIVKRVALRELFRRTGANFERFDFDKQ